MSSYEVLTETLIRKHHEELSKLQEKLDNREELAKEWLSYNLPKPAEVSERLDILNKFCKLADSDNPLEAYKATKNTLEAAYEQLKEYKEKEEEENFKESLFEGNTFVGNSDRLSRIAGYVYAR